MRRFEAVWRSDCERPIWDSVLFDLGEDIVVPTLGSIVPNWLLIIPKTEFLNYKQVSLRRDFDPVRLVSALRDSWPAAADKLVWFEHGPQQTGTTMGCGLDYAHIHVLIDPKFSLQELIATANIQEPTLSWRAFSYDQLPSSERYLIAGDLRRTYSATVSSALPSQFLRRVVAQISGKPERWDYRVWSHVRNIRTTLQSAGASLG
jgi:hypothetical protein